MDSDDVNSGDLAVYVGSRTEISVVEEMSKYGIVGIGLNNLFEDAIKVESSYPPEMFEMILEQVPQIRSHSKRTILLLQRYLQNAGEKYVDKYKFTDKFKNQIYNKTLRKTYKYYVEYSKVEEIITNEKRSIELYILY